MQFALRARRQNADAKATPKVWDTYLRDTGRHVDGGVGGEGRLHLRLRHLACVERGGERERGHDSVKCGMFA